MSFESEYAEDRLMSKKRARNGMQVRIEPDWARVYRRPGTPLEGVLVSISPSGSVVKLRMDEVADSYVRVEHVRPAA